MPARFEFDAGKAVQAILYLAVRKDLVPVLDKYRAVKLLFLADKYHLVRYGRPILGDEYRALDYGPVPQSALDLLHAVVGDYRGTVERELLADSLDVDRRFKHPHLSLRAEAAVDLDLLSDSELRDLESVMTRFGRMDFGELMAITHAMPAYRRPWEARPEGAQMVLMKYEDFFDEDPDAVAGALDEMQEDSALAEAFPGHIDL
jgi:uncharacterized phage-associated protein